MRCGRHPRAGERSSRPLGLARAVALLPAILPGGYAWLLARHVARVASCLKEREGTTELEECSAVPLPLRGLGWRPADGQSLERKTEDEPARLITPAAV